VKDRRATDENEVSMTVPSFLFSKELDYEWCDQSGWKNAKTYLWL